MLPKTHFTQNVTCSLFCGSASHIKVSKSHMYVRLWLGVHWDTNWHFIWQHLGVQIHEVIMLAFLYIHHLDLFMVYFIQCTKDDRAPWTVGDPRTQNPWKFGSWDWILLNWGGGGQSGSRIQEMVRVRNGVVFLSGAGVFSFHFISFHFISFHFISFHFISFHFICQKKNIKHLTAEYRNITLIK